MTDFSLKSKSLLVRELNDRYNAFIADTDVDFINLTALSSGAYNTRVTIVARETGSFRDSAEFSYNRVSIGSVIPEPIVYLSLAGITTTEDIIARLNVLYGTAFETDDIVVEPVSPTALTSAIGVFTLKATVNSLAYIGSMEVYFGAASAIGEWVRNPYYEYQSDGKTFTLSGKSRVSGKNFLIGKKGTFTPTTAQTGISLLANNALSLVGGALTAETTVSRYRAGTLLEMTGPSYETSYDSNNNCLPTVPKLPAPFNALGELFTFTGALNQGLMTFSSDFDLGDWYYRHGTVYYIDAINGSDNAEGSSTAPMKTLNAALDKTPAANTIIILSGGTHYVSKTINDRVIGIYGQGDAKPVLAGKLSILNWTAYSDSTNTYQYLNTGLAIAGVADNSILDSNGLPKRLTKVADPVAVVNTPGSYYVSSTAILVHTSNDRKPDNDIVVVTAGSGLRVTGKSTVYLENLAVKETDQGIIAETLLIGYRPNLWMKNVDISTTFTNGCLNNYGAEVFAQSCNYSDGWLYGSYHGADRQTIALGVNGTFLEVNCTVEKVLRTGAGECRGSLVTAGTVGIRFKSTYRIIDGYPVEEYGTGTFVAHIETVCGSNSQTDALKGALYCAGKATSGSTTYGRSAMYLYSCGGNNTDKLTHISYGSGEIHLYNTPVGTIAQYTKANPYKFIYTSTQIAAIEEA